MRRPWLPSLMLIAGSAAAQAQPAGAPDPATVELFVLGVLNHPWARRPRGVRFALVPRPRQENAS